MIFIVCCWLMEGYKYHVLYRMMSRKIDQAIIQGAPAPALESVWTGSGLSYPQLPCSSSGLKGDADKFALVMGSSGLAVQSTYHEELSGPTAVLALYRTFERWWDRPGSPIDSSTLRNMPASFILLWHAAKRGISGLCISDLICWGIQTSCSLLSFVFFSPLACCKLVCAMYIWDVQICKNNLSALWHTAKKGEKTIRQNRQSGEISCNPCFKNITSVCSFTCPLCTASVFISMFLSLMTAACGRGKRNNHSNIGSNSDGSNACRRKWV